MADRWVPTRAQPLEADDVEQFEDMVRGCEQIGAKEMQRHIRDSGKTLSVCLIGSEWVGCRFYTGDTHETIVWARRPSNKRGPA